jgi:hypothetical protein
MRRRLKVITAASAAAAGLVLTPAPHASAYTLTSQHHLMVYKPDYVNSVFVSTTDSHGGPASWCEELSWGEGWKDAHSEVFDGQPMTLITFSSWDCTAGYTLRKNFTVPRNDGLKNVWAYMK